MTGRVGTGDKLVPAPLLIREDHGCRARQVIKPVWAAAGPRLQPPQGKARPRGAALAGQGKVRGKGNSLEQSGRGLPKLLPSSSFEAAAGGEVMIGLGREVRK
jgi:hypothetical protein